MGRGINSVTEANANYKAKPWIAVEVKQNILFLIRMRKKKRALARVHRSCDTWRWVFSIQFSGMRMLLLLAIVYFVFFSAKRIISLSNTYA